MVAVPTTIFPVSERFVGIARELTSGSAANPGPTLPLTSFTPVDKPVWVMDEAWRGSMAMEYDMLQGPIWTDTGFAGPVYGDTIGHLLYNILGDYTQSATANTPNTTLTANAAAGATSLTVASGTSFTVGMQIQVFAAGSTGPAEIVTVSTGGSTSITLNALTPLRFAHSSGATVTNTTVASSTYANTFSLLNSGNGQPVTHTFTDRTQIPGSGNNNAVQYAYGCLSGLTLNGNSQGIFTHTGTLTSYFHAYPSANPVASVSGVRATPNWRSTVGLNGPESTNQIFDITEWEIALTRVVQPIPTNDGSQNPYVIARGRFSATLKLLFSPSTDETALTYMLNNTQPQFQVVYSNGLSAANNITYTINAQVAAFDTANINESGALFGYDVTAKLIANTTNTGWSLGYSPLSITVNNATAVY